MGKLKSADQGLFSIKDRDQVDEYKETLNIMKKVRVVITANYSVE